MKKFLMFAVLASIMFLSATVFADTLSLTTLPSQTAGGYYVGGVGGNVNGGASTFFFCDDFASTTYVPSSFAVNVSTIPTLTYAKWRGQENALFKYQQAAWLISQISLNPSQVGAIQFAIWNIFYPAAPDLSGQNDWILQAQNINPADYDFSSVRIYTPVSTTNPPQEFMSGGATPVPEPGTLLLLCSGLIGLAFLAKRKFGERN